MLNPVLDLMNAGLKRYVFIAITRLDSIYTVFRTYLNPGKPKIIFHN